MKSGGPINLNWKLYFSICRSSMTNLAVQSYGEEVSRHIVATFCLSYRKHGKLLKVVSVGSGNADLEYKVKLMCPEIGWICVDPSPESFRNDIPVRIKPDYPTVEDLIKDKPEVVGCCLVFANWCLYGEQNYDYKAIIQLKPFAFLSTIEKLKGKPGAAGSYDFHTFLDLTTDYKCVYSSRLFYDPIRKDEPYDIRFVWYEWSVLKSKPQLKRNWKCLVVHPRGVPSLGR